MSKARVQKNQAKLIVHSAILNIPIFSSEIDSFKATSTTTVHKSRPAGYALERATPVYGGYDLSFDGGKVDWEMAHFYWLQDNNLRAGKMPPSIYISETIFHYGGAIENYIYKDVVLFGKEISIADEVSNSIQGFASMREQGVIDTTVFAGPGNLVRDTIFAFIDTQGSPVANIANEIGKYIP